jgi:hypothetical protein
LIVKRSGRRLTEGAARGRLADQQPWRLDVQGILVTAGSNSNPLLVVL